MAGLRETWWLWARPLVLQIALCALGAICIVPSRVSADAAPASQQNALARALFEEGVALADKSDWVGAADRFSRAYSLKPTSGIAFNWASVLIELGHLLHAQELLLGVSRDSAADTQIRADSATMLDALSRRIAHLKVHVVDQRDAQSTIEVDNLAWPRAAWDIASPIDPGAHTVVLKHGTSEAARVDLTLNEGEARELVLEGEQAPAPVVVAPVLPSKPIDSPTKKPLYKNWMLWAGVGAVVVGGVVAAAVLAKGKDPKEASPVMGNTMPGVLRW